MVSQAQFNPAVMQRMPGGPGQQQPQLQAGTVNLPPRYVPHLVNTGSRVAACCTVSKVARVARDFVALRYATPKTDANVAGGTVVQVSQQGPQVRFIPTAAKKDGR